MSKFFTDKEVACKCGKCTSIPMDKEFMEKMDKLREICGFPFRVTSAYRCPTYNKVISSSGLNGPHTTGKAMDIYIDGQQCYRVLKEAMKLGFTGIGVKQKGYARFLHLDTLTSDGVHTRPIVWSY